MPSSLSRALIVALSVTLCLLAGQAFAAARSHPWLPISKGESPHNVPWLISGQRGPGKQINFQFSFRPPGYSDAGYVAWISRPIPARFHVLADVGSDIDPYLESDLSGFTAKRVASLEVQMRNGSTLEIEPQLPSQRLRQKHHWLRGLRFFDSFFHAGRYPQLVKALDDEGRVLARVHSNQGFFHG